MPTAVRIEQNVDQKRDGKIENSQAHGNGYRSQKTAANTDVSALKCRHDADLQTRWREEIELTNTLMRLVRAEVTRWNAKKGTMTRGRGAPLLSSWLQQKFDTS